MAKKSQQPTPLVTKTEALEILSAQMRRTDLQPNQLIKLSTTYAKIAGWAMRPTQAKLDSTEKPTLNQLVEIAERQRKQLKNKFN